jgi:hypothetical protein
VLRAQTAVTPDASPKLLIGVVIDAHPQQQNVVEFQRHVVESLRSALAGIMADVFVISYSDHVRQIVDWSPADSGLRDASSRIALDNVVDKTRGAVLDDGLREAVTRLASSGDGDRKALIVIGEGNDGGSSTKFSQVLDTSKRQSIQCFAVFVATHRAQVGRVRQFGFNLMRLASGTHGKLYDVRAKQEALDKAMRDLRKRLTMPVHS